jgi:hypothetical protein
MGCHVRRQTSRCTDDDNPVHSIGTGGQRSAQASGAELKGSRKPVDELSMSNGGGFAFAFRGRH